DSHGAVVRRRLDEDPAARCEVAEDEVQPLERAVRHDDAARLDAVQLRDPLAQRRVAAGRPVVEDRLTVALERGPRAVGELGHGKQLWRGNPAREGDHGHGRSLVAVLARAPADWHPAGALGGNRSLASPSLDQEEPECGGHWLSSPPRRRSSSRSRPRPRPETSTSRSATGASPRRGSPVRTLRARSRGSPTGSCSSAATWTGGARIRGRLSRSRATTRTARSTGRSGAEASGGSTARASSATTR